MNQEKAREFFSAYYEDTLEPGLRQTLEQRLRADESLRSEYAAFEETMNDLGALKLEEIEIPSFLSDRIATRLEAVQEKARPASWTLWVRNLGFAGLAAAAIFGAVISLRPASGPGIASPLPSAGTDQLELKANGREVAVSYRSSGTKEITVRHAVTGKVLEQVKLNGQRLENNLQNSNPTPTTFRIDVNGEKPPTFVAVPGTKSNGLRTGQGSLRNLAEALADTYRAPVTFSVANPERVVTWNFDKVTDPREAAAHALESHGYGVDLRAGGMVFILDR